jgi:hypothetical protein
MIRGASVMHRFAIAKIAKIAKNWRTELYADRSAILAMFGNSGDFGNR